MYFSKPAGMPPVVRYPLPSVPSSRMRSVEWPESFRIGAPLIATGRLTCTLGAGSGVGREGANGRFQQ